MASHSKEQETIVVKILSYKPHQFYEILSVEKSASEGEIKKSYRKLAVRLHPDKNPHPRADEAFKLLNKAWGVLSDPSKKRIFDQTGSDPDSRGSVGGGSGGGGGAAHPFAGFQRAGGPEEDIFNMFFGGGGGQQFSFGGNGFTFQQFGGGGSPFAHVRQQQQQQARARARAGANGGVPQEASLYDTLKQLLPILLVLIVPIISNLLSGSSSLPQYSFVRTPKFDLQRNTPRHKIPFFVTPQYGADKSPRQVNNYDSKIEDIYIQDKQAKCSRERAYKNELIEDAQGWFSTDLEKLAKAQRMQMPNCEKLRELNLI